MGFTSILKTIGTVGLKTADIGASLHLPVLTQIDKAADALKDLKGKSHTEHKAIAQVVSSLTELKTAVASLPAGTPDKSALQSKKFIAVLVGALVSLAAPYLGLMEAQVTELTEAVTTMVVVFVGAQGLQDMVGRLRR